MIKIEQLGTMHLDYIKKREIFLSNEEYDASLCTVKFTLTPFDKSKWTQRTNFPLSRVSRLQTKVKVGKFFHCGKNPLNRMTKFELSMLPRVLTDNIVFYTGKEVKCSPQVQQRAHLQEVSNKNR